MRFKGPGKEATVRKPVTTNTHRLNLPELLGPDLPGARCRGEAPYFDARVPGEKPRERRQRLTTAHDICNRCPALTACADAILGTPPPERRGVWAGTTYDRH